MKYGPLKLESLSPWKLILLTSPQGHGSDMLIRFSMRVFLCVASVQKCKGIGGWGRLKGCRAAGGGRREWEDDGSFTRPLNVRSSDWTGTLYILHSPTCFSLLSHQPVIRSSALSGSSEWLFSPWEIKKKQPGLKKKTWLVLTLGEIWQNFLFWVLDSCYGSSAMYSMIIVGMFSVIWV